MFTLEFIRFLPTEIKDIQYLNAIFFFQAEDGIRDIGVTGVQTCALPICHRGEGRPDPRAHSRPAGAPRRGGSGADRFPPGPRRGGGGRVRALRSRLALGASSSRSTTRATAPRSPTSSSARRSIARSSG